MEVVNEFARGAVLEPHRGWILERLKPEQGFYRFCTSYDSIVIAVIQGQKGIDKGEAEAYAQLKKVNAHLIISDDKLFAGKLKQIDSTIRIYSTVHIVCWLDILGYIPDWKGMVSQLHQLRPFTSEELRSVYIHMSQVLGLYVKRKVISEKCSLSKIL